MTQKNVITEAPVQLNKKVVPFLITKDISVREAMRCMDTAGKKILFVVDVAGTLRGSISDGDIRRGILKDIQLTDEIEEIYNKNPFYIERGYRIDDVKNLMLTNHIEWIPVVDNLERVCEVLFWRDIFGDDVHLPKGRIDLPVVIMAGGKGTRLDPFTKILPKPLIPIHDRTILEIIFEKFLPHGVKEFYLSIGHKCRMIKAYFDELNPPYKINYIVENEPLGTVGSLSFLKDIVDESLLVSNCDIIVEEDYYEIVQFHKSNNCDITIVGSFRHFTVPYGVCHIQNGGSLVEIQEKPEFDFLVNTGMYIVKKQILEMIPKNQFFHFTDLINQAKKEKAKISVYPIHENSWIDVGQWKEYHRALRLLELDD